MIELIIEVLKIIISSFWHYESQVEGFVSTHRIHGSRLEVHQDGAGHVTAAGGLVEVDVDALKLQIRISVVRASRVDAVLITDHLPELRTDLVAALAALDVHELTHLSRLPSLE